MAFAQKFGDEIFELNKLLDEIGAELNRLSEKTTQISDNVPDQEETTPKPVPAPSAVPDREDFATEIRRQISVEEEIQNCDLSRLAILASNVAWRFQELSKQFTPGVWAERAAGTWHPGDEV